MLLKISNAIRPYTRTSFLLRVVLVLVIVDFISNTFMPQPQHVDITIDGQGCPVTATASIE